MPDEQSKPKPQSSPKPAESKDDEQTKGPGPGSLKEGQEVGEEVDAEAPGPITPEHESGSWEQTKAEQEAQEKAREAGKGKSS